MQVFNLVFDSQILL